MSGVLDQPKAELHKLIALFAIAFELKYGTVDQLLTQMIGQGDPSSNDGEKMDDQIKQIDEQIKQVKEHAARLEEKAGAMTDLLPGLMAAIGSDPGESCPDSEPRKAEFFRLWDDPVFILDDWLRLSQSFSEKEKASFVERMMSMMEKYDLSQLSFSALYPKSTL